MGMKWYLRESELPRERSLLKLNPFLGGNITAGKDHYAPFLISPYFKGEGNRGRKGAQGLTVWPLASS